MKDTARVIRSLGSLAGPQPGKGDRTIYDDKNAWAFDGELVRGEADTATGTENVDLAHDYAGDLVGMESTGVYWKPVYYVLEDRFSVWVINAEHLRNVAGRKTDVADSCGSRS